MIVEDLNHLEVVTESAQVEGGILNVGSGQLNGTPIRQDINANAGGGLLAIGNVALGLNIALPIQLNL